MGRSRSNPRAALCHLNNLTIAELASLYAEAGELAKGGVRQISLELVKRRSLWTISETGTESFEQLAALGPIAEATRLVEVAKRANFDQARAPRVSPRS